MKLSSMMSKSDWDFIKANGGIFALLIAAIGEHETNCGKAGAGRDWFCGYDYFNGPGGMQNQYKGFPNQIIAVAKFLQEDMAQPVNSHNLYMFSRNFWRAGTTQPQRDAWSKDVWALHAEIDNDYDGTGIIPRWMPKFGRKKKTPDNRDLLYKKYRTGTLPTRTATFGHYTIIGTDAWGMLGNDEYGDCTCAAADHETMYWTAEAKDPASFTAANTEADYFAITGGKDDGAVIRDVLQYRTNTGMIDASGKRHKIAGYVSLDETNLDEVDEACFIFEGVELGINVTQGMMDAFDAGQPWTKEACAGDSLGGHDVPYLGTDGTWLYVITWGQLQHLDPAAYPGIVEEAWAILSDEYLVSGATVDGINLAALQADLAAITADPIPTPEPAPTPPAPVPVPTAVFSCGKNAVVMDGTPVPIDSDPSVTPMLIDQLGRVFFPIRFMPEMITFFGGERTTLTWDEATLTATMTESATGKNEYVELLKEKP